MIAIAVSAVCAPLIPISADQADRPGQAEIRFNRDIRPILSNRCFKCHGPDLKKAGLDLQTSEGATKELKSGEVAIVPGKSAQSVLLQRVLEADDSKRMPPKGKGEPLSATQVKLLRAWIDQGAKYEPHWSYAKVERPALPKVKNAAWPRNGIDRFILARLEQEKLAPSPEADRATLVRRVTVDLTGLPPTLAEVDDALNDKSPEWYEKVVDRLLRSPHYGERQARPWLDLARYADTNGYENDARRTIWPYRDWVINVFNRDLPFDQFTIEQIAGDLLPSATLEQKIATGFHRNTMVNTEGGTDPEEFRIVAVVDRVNTTMEVWMGSTFACAQCHNHKYDPFSQKEYYQLFAFFNGTMDTGGNVVPTLPVPSAEETARRELIRGEMAKVQKVLDTQTPELDASQAKWEKSAVAQTPAWTTLQPTEMTAANGSTFTKQPDGSILVGGANPATDIYRFQAGTDLKGITAIRLEVLSDNSLPRKGPGRAAGNFVLSELRLQVAAKATPDQVKPIALQNAVADFSQPGFEVAKAIDGKPDTGWAVSPQFGKAHVAVFETKENAGGDGGSILHFTLEQNHGSQHTIGKLRLSATTSPRPVGLDTIPDAVAKLLAIPADKRNAEQKLELAKYYRSIVPELAKVRQQLDALQKQDAAIQPATTMVMKELPTPRPTNVMIRGNFKNLGDKVTPGVPAAIGLPLSTIGQPKAEAIGLPRSATGQAKAEAEGRKPIADGGKEADSRQPTRLDLAHWLVDPKNPLVGRVTMNRLWAQHFGRGFVETGEDFGVQGELPTHPELLDWLASEFVTQKWSIKAMHRLIVTSATYRQSSKVTKELHERDQYNRLLARGPRFRMEAEMLRDNALAISGLLSRKIGGPSVFPYQPDGVWANPYSGDKWVMSTNGDQHRRGLYTFWRRTAPYASFMSFDAPSREVCTERRPRTNTPLQALAVLNDSAFVECAQALARRMTAETKGPEKERAIHGFRLCVARPPNNVELDYLLKLYRENLEKYKANAEAARSLVGSLPLPQGADVAELAAWTVVANVLLNLDETITQG
jgi:hypothetical protein